MTKLFLFICAFLIVHLSIAQDKLDLIVASSSKATLSVNGNDVTNNGSAVIDVVHKTTIISISGAGVSDKILIKIDRETTPKCDPIEVLPQNDRRIQISKEKGILISEVLKNIQVGGKMKLMVLEKEGNDLKPIASWTITTGLKTLATCTDVGSEPGFVTQATGIAYYDALALDKLKNNDTTSRSSILKILGFYAGKDLNAQDLDSVFKDNSFILEYVNSRFPVNPDTGKRQSTAGEEGAKKLSSLASSALSSLGGLDVTNIADGFARFLVKRTKQELNITFFTKFKEQISKPEFRDLQTVFPQTFRALQAIGDDIYNYQVYIQTLRESFEKDLANILSNMSTIIDNHPEFFKTQPELEAILRTGFYIALGLQDKQHPGDIIASYPEAYLDSVNSNFKAGIQTLKIFSNSLRYNDADPETDRYWITDKEIKVLVKNREAFKLYLGLIEAEAKKIQVFFFKADKSKVSLAALIDSAFKPISKDLPQYELYIKNLQSRMQVVENKIQGLKGINKDSLLLENYYSFFSSTLDLLKYATEAEDLPHFKETFPGVNLKEETAPYLDAAQISADIVIDVNRRNYGSAITNAYSLWNMIFAKDREGKLTALNSALTQVKTVHKKDLDDLNNLQDSLDNLKKKQVKEREELVIKIKSKEAMLKPVRLVERDIKTLQAGDDVMALFYKYGTFMATIVQAQSSDEVQQAIEAFALPPGSSRIKRESSFNVSINAYTGLFTGYEHLTDVDDKLSFNSYGLTAPVGVAVSWGKNHWSYSAFLSLVDLGAIAAYRFKTDTDTDTLQAQQVPTINLRDIFSPGLFFSLGIPKTPLSINAGGQVGPNLRHIEDTKNGGVVNAYENSTYWRFSVSILIDIPIVNLYTKTRDKKR